MDKPSPFYAAIDMGSNSFHMLVVREVEGSVQTIAKIKRKVRLAAGLDDNNKLDKEAMQRGWECLALFAERLQDIPADQIEIMATATLRLASNANKFIAEAERILGHSIQVISGEEEAALIYKGVVYTSSGHSNRLVIDIGGASTELVVGKGLKPKHLISTYMGCVTWRNNYFADDKLNDDNFDAAIKAARKQLKPHVDDFRKVGWEVALGASGTVRAIQEVMQENGEDEQITLKKLTKLREQVIACKHFDKLSITGLDESRVPVFPSGLAILIALFESLDIQYMLTSNGALREGVVFEMLDQESSDVRNRTVEKLQTRFYVDTEHAELAKRTCMRAYDQVKRDDDKTLIGTLLAYAARLHELGLIIQYKQLTHICAYILENTELPGFTQAQRDLLVALSLAQRGSFPLEPFQNQTALPLQKSLLMARILRIALILCLRRTKDSIPDFLLHQEDEILHLTLPNGWHQAHPLRAAELEKEVDAQARIGLPLVISEAD